MGLGFEVWGLGFGVWGLGFGVWGLGVGFGVWGLGSGLVSKAHRRLYHSTLGLRVIQKKKFGVYVEVMRSR